MLKRINFGNGTYQKGVKKNKVNLLLVSAIVKGDKYSVALEQNIEFDEEYGDYLLKIDTNDIPSFTTKYVDIMDAIQFINIINTIENGSNYYKSTIDFEDAEGRPYRIKIKECDTFFGPSTKCRIDVLMYKTEEYDSEHFILDIEYDMLDDIADMLNSVVATRVF